MPSGVQRSASRHNGHQRVAPQDVPSSTPPWSTVFRGIDLPPRASEQQGAACVKRGPRDRVRNVADLELQLSVIEKTFEKPQTPTFTPPGVRCDDYSKPKTGVHFDDVVAFRTGVFEFPFLLSRGVAQNARKAPDTDVHLQAFVVTVYSKTQNQCSAAVIPGSTCIGVHFDDVVAFRTGVFEFPFSLSRGVPENARKASDTDVHPPRRSS
ncbi:hypothetical protein DFH06DRAFT_1301004 [Mycena polygramma]|nr:hypothetical protein DFH06DRAFT_1301004 [Mycena polygramma]